MTLMSLAAGGEKLQDNHKSFQTKNLIIMFMHEFTKSKPDKLYSIACGC